MMIFQGIERSFSRIAARTLLPLLLLSSTSAMADLSASVTLVSGDPTNIYPGESTRLEITLGNSNTGSTITGVAFNTSLPGTLPDGLKIAGAASYDCTDPAGPSTSAGSGTLTATTGTQAINLSGGVIPARANNTDGTCTIRVPVTAETSSGNSTTYDYIIGTGVVSGNDGGAVSNSGSVSQSININALAKPTLSKNFASSSVTLGGGTTTLTITLSNSNPVAIPGFSITDAFPVLGVGGGIIKVAAVPGASASCNNGGGSPSFSPSAGDKTITATGTIPAESGGTNGQCTLTVSIEADHTNGGYSTGNQTNRIDSSSDFSNDLGIPAAADATDAINVISPLNLSKSFAHSTLSDGQSDSLTITLTNNGNTDLTVSNFNDAPIDGVDADPSTGLLVTGQSTTCAGGSVTAINSSTGINLSGGTIPANGSCTVTVNFTGTVATAGVPITYTNTIAQGAVDVGNAAIVSRARSASILVADDLRVLKSASPTNAAPGNPVQYTVTVQNYSASSISNLRINDSLPAGMTFLTGTINGNDYSASLAGTGCSVLTTSSSTGDANADLTITTVPARTGINTPSSCAVTFWAMTGTAAADGSSTVNTLSAGSVCYNSGATCNGAAASSQSGTRVETTIASASKRFNNKTSETLAEGTIATLKFTITNSTANPLTNVTLSDSFPIDGSGQLQIASPANASSTCGTPVITAVAGTTSIAMNGGTVPARAANGTGSDGSCELTVDVIGPAGNYPNTAQVAGTQTYANGTTAAVAQFDTDTATLSYLSSLSGSKSFTPTRVSSGGKSTVTVRLSNSGAVALTSVSLTDPLPTGMVLANPVNAYSTCAGAPSFTSATPGASTITMTGATLAGNGSCDVLFDVVATGTSDWLNSIPVGNITADGGVRNISAVSDTLYYDAPTNLSIAKTTSPSTLTFPGETSQLTITITNGSQAVTSLAVSDYFTADGTSGAALNGMAVAATPGASTSCPGGVISAASGATSVSLSGVSLSAGASCTLSVNVTSSAVGGITNYIPASAISTDQGLTNSGQATTSLTTQSNIGVVKKFTPNVVKPGERSRLRITFYNPTAQPMADVTVTDTLPAGVTVPGGANPTATCTGASVTSPASNQVAVSGASIVAASGTTAASCYVEIDVLVASQGEYVNTIGAGTVTGTAGGKSVTNSQPTSDTLLARLPLEIHKAFDSKTLDSGNPVGFTTGSASVAPGASSTLTIRLDNTNAQALTGAAFTDNLPSGLVVAQTPSASTTCSGGFVDALASATSVRLSGATVPATGSCTLTVDVLSNVSGSYTNTIATAAVTTNEGVSNEEPTSAELIVSTPPTVDKQFMPAVIASGGTSTLTIVFGNDNSSAITLSSVFTDTLPTSPGNILVASTPNIVSSCPGSVTAAAGSGSVSYASGASIPAGGCSISVDVTGTTSGEHINNIPAGDLQTSVGNNQQPANSSLLISPLGYVSGKVFNDNNLTPNGAYDDGTDTPIAGVSIELRSGADCSGALVSVAGVSNPATTDGLGNYLFAKLPAGTYSVCQPVQPGGTTNGTTTAGAITAVNGSTGTIGAASNPSASSSQIVGIVLNGDGGASEVSGSGNNNFAEVIPSGIAGVVFKDENNNGVRNGADSALSGVTIELLNSGSSVISSTTTDADGAYSFSGLAPGTYSVREPAQPAGTANGQTVAGTVANGGTAGTASGLTTLPSVISTIILPPNTDTRANNFAEIPQGARISGQVFLDYDNSGTVNGSDHGIGGQTINLTGTDINGNPVSAATTTANDGSYSFTGLPQGTYTLTQPAQPNGTSNGITTAGSAGGTATGTGTTPSSISAVVLASVNSVSSDNDFAEQPDSAPDLAIRKSHSPASFGAGSATGVYTITPSNIGTLSTSGTLTIVDTLPAGITATAVRANSDWSCAIVGQTVTCTSTSVIGAGGTGTPILLEVSVGSGLSGQLLINTVQISGGGEPPGFDGNNDDDDPTPIADSAQVSGRVWRDTDHDRVRDAGEALVSGWEVELLLSGTTVRTSYTAADGSYSFTGISPSSGYQIAFRDPDTGSSLGRPLPNESGAVFTSGVDDDSNNPAGADNSGSTLDSLTLIAGDDIQEQSLPLDPSGVVYNAVTRDPVEGAVVTISGPVGFSPATHLVGGTANVSQTTSATGFYQFLFFNTAPSGTYTLTVTEPAGYLPGGSQMIPVCSNTPTVAAAPDPALVQSSNTAPAITASSHDASGCPTSSAGFAAGAGSTQYYLSFVLDPGLPSGNVLNNHVPLDPILEGALTVTKSAAKDTVSRGDLVPYTITAINNLTVTLNSVELVDQMPPGFKYVEGSARLDQVETEPVRSGRELRWSNLTFTAGQTRSLALLLIPGSGVSDGEYTNRAWTEMFGNRTSNIASAVVLVVPDPTFDCSDIIGKVFDDHNLNGYQDEGEPGLAGVRVVTVNGELITTDASGRYHVTCAATPDEMRGASYILKLDTRTLPSGYRVTTENPRVIRLTRGKISKLNFGAGIHRVVRLELAGAAFVEGKAELAAGYLQRIDGLIGLLRESPSVLRLAYRLTDGEGEEAAEARLEYVDKLLRERWQDQEDCCYDLQLEKETVPAAVSQEVDQ